MLSYISGLVDGFDDTMADADPISLTELEPTDCIITNVLSFGDVLGHGKYGIVRKAVLASTGEVVAAKIIRKSDLSDRDVSALKVPFPRDSHA